MGLFDEKKEEESPISAAILVGSVVFLITWYLRSLSMAAAIGAAAALFTWAVSAWSKNSEPKITYIGATSWTNPFEPPKRSTEFLEKTLIPLAVCVAAAWGVWKLFGGIFLALMVGAVVTWRILKRLAEERERRKNEEFASALMFGAGLTAAVGLGALAGWGMRRR